MLTALKKNNVAIKGNTNAKTTMIFAHGFGTDQTSWNHVSDAFKNDYRIVLYDNVGGGNSAPEAFSPNKYDTLDTYAQDLIDICDELSINDAIMVGHSVSGMVSMLAAIKKPELFSKMVMVSASPRYLNDDGYVGGFNQSDLDGLYQAMATNYFAWVSGFAPAAMDNHDRPQLAENFANSLSAIRPDIAQSVARVIFQSDYRNEVPKLNKETLLLQTKHDIAVPMDVAQFLNGNIKNSKLNVVEATGHFPHISAPGEIITSVQNFLA
jgi:sigma-B regulation protein RsbQ